jgi:DNA-binding CsgD family transcriptional regulator
VRTRLVKFSTSVGNKSGGSAIQQIRAATRRIPDCIPYGATGKMESKRLTPREDEIARLLSTGASNLAIAEKLGISISTVETHVKRVRAKLGIRGRSRIALAELP